MQVRTFDTMWQTYVAVWRDERLKQVAPATVLREMGDLVLILNHAMKEWGIVLLCEFNGLMEAFVDDDQEADRLAVRFTTESGRAELLDCVDRDFAGDFDGFLARLPTAIAGTAVRLGERYVAEAGLAVTPLRRALADRCPVAWRNSRASWCV